jgi:hypothetical protein
MKRRILGVVVTCVTMIHLGSSLCTAADVKVMYAVGILDYGEDAKLLTTGEFNQTVVNYEKFRDRVAKAPTLKEMVQNGWTIVHVEQIRAGNENPYRELNYLIIFQGDRHR